MNDNRIEYTGPERRSRAHDHLVEAIVEAVKSNYPQPACLTDEEQQWVRMAIKVQADRAALRKAVIEKSLAGLAWAAIAGICTILMDGLRSHGWK